MSDTSKYFIRGLHNWISALNKSVVSIGNFDGVHSGHVSTLKLLRETADTLGLPAVVVILETQALTSDATSVMPALTRRRDKVRHILATGVDAVLYLRVNDTDLKQPRVFLEQVLRLIDPHCLVSGSSFQTGRGARQDVAMLEALSRSLAFDLVRSDELTWAGLPISADMIQDAVSGNDFQLAEKLLGRPFVLTGKVARGQQLGRQLGAPTANLAFGGQPLPLSGVYAVQVTLPDGSVSFGVANIGARPTVGDLVKPILEVHLLDFNRDIYGQQIDVRPLYKIRNEQKFSSLETLKTAIAGDIQTAKAYFAGQL